MSGNILSDQGTLGLNNNYTIIFQESDLEIMPKPVTVSANSRKKVHGEPDPDLTYNITSGILSKTDTIYGWIEP